MEDLSFKKNTFIAEKAKEYKAITNPADLFKVDGKSVEKIYMLGEAGRGKTGQCLHLLHHWIQAREAMRQDEVMTDWQSGLAAFDLLLFVSLRHVDKCRHSLC